MLTAFHSAMISHEIQNFSAADRIIDENYAAYCLQGSTSDADWRTVCRVVSIASLAHNNLHTAKLGILRDPDFLDNVYALVKDGVESAFYKGTLRGRWPATWITDESELRKHCPLLEAGNDAARIKSLLGLFHVQIGDRLVLIRIPGRPARELQARVPLCTDAGSYYYFQSLLRDTASGWTLDLTHNKGGAPELVAPPITFDGNCTLVALGVIEVDCNCSVVDLPSACYYRNHRDRAAGQPQDVSL